MTEINLENTIEETITNDVMYVCTNGVMRVMSEEEKQAHLAELASIPLLVPAGIEMRQLRLYLLNAELLSTVNTEIGKQTDEAIKIEWEYATMVLRESSLLSTIAEIIKLDSDGIDDLLRAAVEL